MAHQYVITAPIDGVTDDLPQLRDPDNLVYFRRESGGLVLGGYERDPAPWSVHGVPADFNNKLLPEDWDRFAPIMTNAIAARARGRVRPTSSRSSTDRRGSRPTTSSCSARASVHGLFVAAGFCAHGIAGAGGVGRVMAEWILDGEPTLRHLEDGHPPLRRAVPRAATSRSPAPSRCTRPTTTSTIRTRNGARVGRCAAPPRTTASPRSAASSARRACGSARTGSRRTSRSDPRTCARTGWAGEHWSPAIEVEALACRDAVAIFDETSFSKLEVARRRARARSSSACAPTRSTGRSASVTYTQLCNERGGIECDLTVTRLGADPVPARHRDRVRCPRSRLAPQAAGRACPRATPSRSSTSPAATRASACGARARAMCSRR